MTIKQIFIEDMNLLIGFDARQTSNVWNILRLFFTAAKENLWMEPCWFGRFIEFNFAIVHALNNVVAINISVTSKANQFFFKTNIKPMVPSEYSFPISMLFIAPIINAVFFLPAVYLQVLITTSFTDHYSVVVVCNITFWHLSDRQYVCRKTLEYCCE